MFRVSIRGKFVGLSDAHREIVRAANGVGFTEAGLFSHDATMAVFNFRCQVNAKPEDGDDEATLGALTALDAYELPYTIVQTSVVDMRDIKVRR